jgi:hypothetical protein
MELLGLWFVGGIIVALIASAKGRSGCGWFLYGFLIWPVALVHILVVGPNTRVLTERSLRRGEAKQCPHCAELIKADARVCRYCQREV